MDFKGTIRFFWADWFYSKLLFKHNKHEWLKNQLKPKLINTRFEKIELLDLVGFNPDLMFVSIRVNELI